jgi:hypothetical protein
VVTPFTACTMMALVAWSLGQLDEVGPELCLFGRHGSKQN